MPYVQKPLTYFCSVGTIGTREQIQPNTVLSYYELIWQGLPRERIKNIPQALQPIDAEISRIKADVGLTPELEAQRQAELDNELDLYDKAFEMAKQPSDFARLFIGGMEDWNVVFQAYVSRAKPPLPHLTNRSASTIFSVVAAPTYYGFSADHERAHLDLIENHIARIFEKLKPHIAGLSDLPATNLQNFVNSLSVYSVAYGPKNLTYSAAHNDADILIHKFKAQEDKAAKEQKEADDKKGFKGWTKDVKIADKG